MPAAVEPAKNGIGSSKEGQSVRSRLRSIFRGKEAATLVGSENVRATVRDLEPAKNGNGAKGNGSAEEEVSVHREFVTLGPSENGNGNGNRDSKERAPVSDGEPATVEHAKREWEWQRRHSCPDGEPADQ